LTTVLVAGMTLLAALLGAIAPLRSPAALAEQKFAVDPEAGNNTFTAVFEWLARVQQLAPVVATRRTIDVNLFAMVAGQ
jgi:hypothetical protein